MADWPTCRHCDRPCAPYVRDPNKPRVECFTAGCLKEQEQKSRAEWLRERYALDDKQTLANFPQWPMCPYCEVRPRARNKFHSQEGKIAIWSHCSKECRNADVGPPYTVYDEESLT